MCAAASRESTVPAPATAAVRTLTKRALRLLYSNARAASASDSSAGARSTAADVRGSMPPVLQRGGPHSAWGLARCAVRESSFAAGSCGRNHREIHGAAVQASSETLQRKAASRRKNCVRSPSEVRHSSRTLATRVPRCWRRYPGSPAQLPRMELDFATGCSTRYFRIVTRRCCANSRRTR